MSIQNISYLFTYMFICIKQWLKLNWKWNTLPELTASAQRQFFLPTPISDMNHLLQAPTFSGIFFWWKKTGKSRVSSARLCLDSLNEWLFIHIIHTTCDLWRQWLHQSDLQVCDTNDGQNPAPLKIQERSSAAKMLSIMCCAQCLQKGTWDLWVLPKQTFCGGSYLPT